MCQTVDSPQQTWQGPLPADHPRSCSLSGQLLQYQRLMTCGGAWLLGCGSAAPAGTHQGGWGLCSKQTINTYKYRVQTRTSTEFRADTQTHRRHPQTSVSHHLNTHVAALRRDHAAEARPLMTEGSSTRRCPLTTDNSRQQQVWPAASCADRDRPARCGA
jgi:hypothetical protein